MLLLSRIFLFALAFVFVAASNAPKRAPACNRSNVAKVKAEFRDYKLFCRWYLSGPRVRSPIKALSTAKLHAACKCITPKAKLIKNPKRPSFPRSQKSCTKLYSIIERQTLRPQAFCSFWNAVRATDRSRLTSPFGGIRNALDVHKACRCSRPKPSSRSTTKRRTTTRSTRRSLTTTPRVSQTTGLDTSRTSGSSSPTIAPSSPDPTIASSSQDPTPVTTSSDLAASTSSTASPTPSGLVRQAYIFVQADTKDAQPQWLGKANQRTGGLSVGSTVIANQFDIQADGHIMDLLVCQPNPANASGILSTLSSVCRSGHTLSVLFTAYPDGTISSALNGTQTFAFVTGDLDDVVLGLGSDPSPIGAVRLYWTLSLPDSPSSQTTSATVTTSEATTTSASTLETTSASTSSATTTESPAFSSPAGPITLYAEHDFFGRVYFSEQRNGQPDSYTNGIFAVSSVRTATKFSLDSLGNLIGAFSNSYMSMMGPTEGFLGVPHVVVGNADYWVYAYPPAVNSGYPFEFQRNQISAIASADGTMTLQASGSGNTFTYLCYEPSNLDSQKLLLSTYDDCQYPLKLYWTQDPADSGSNKPSPVPSTYSGQFMLKATFPDVDASPRTEDQYLLGPAGAIFNDAFLGTDVVDIYTLGALGHVTTKHSESWFKMVLVPQDMSSQSASAVFIPYDGTFAPMDVKATLYNDFSVGLEAVGPGGRIFSLNIADTSETSSQIPSNVNWATSMATNGYSSDSPSAATFSYMWRIYFGGG